MHFAGAAQGGRQSLSTKYFTIFYPPGEKKTAEWYASFADTVNVSVSDLLGAEPVSDLTLTIYATEAEYARANPLAETHSGILAHAIPDRKEIGVAVERLRQHPPELARESFRHEMTHVVAGVLSNHRLPVGFQEAFAQYNELSSLRGPEVVAALEAAKSANAPLLSWREVNDRRQFTRRLPVAYPQSYTIMAFLADRYGMGPFGRFLQELKAGKEYDHALLVAYGKPVDELERQWNEYLPGFLKDGWKQNRLLAYDLQPGVSLLEAGRFEEAREHFSQSERLYLDLGKGERATEAAQYIAKAERATEANNTTGEARGALERHEYEAAREKAGIAKAIFSELVLESHAGRAGRIEEMAAQGMAATQMIEDARRSRESLNLPQAASEARQAGEALAALGDTSRVEEANAILAEVWGLQMGAGLGALGVGALASVLGVASALRSRRKRMEAKNSPIYVKESASWL